MKYFNFLFILLIFLLSLATVSAIDNDMSFEDLENQINDYDIVNLTTNVVKEDTYSENGITINKNVTINGNNFTIDACENGRIFNIVGQLTLNNVNLKNGYSISNAGAIFVDNGTLILNKVCFFNNTALINGGAIFIEENSEVYLSHVLFYNNMARFGGSIYNAGNDLIITKAMFYNNKASDGVNYECSGGAIYNNQSNLVVSNTIFKNCTADFSGGAIFNAYGKVIVEDNVLFTNCVVENNGAAIVNIENSFFYFIGNNITLSYNIARYGAIRNYGNFLINGTFVNFINNKAYKVSGGYYTDGGVIFNDNQGIMIITGNSILFKSNAARRGGAIFNAAYLVMDGENIIFKNNSANTEGSSIFNANEAILKNVIIYDLNGIYNNAYLTLNTIDVLNGTIFNDYKILSEVHLMIMDVVSKPKENITINAFLVDDNYNFISGDSIEFFINDVSVGKAQYINGTYQINTTAPSRVGKYFVSAKFDFNENYTSNIAELDVLGYSLEVENLTKIYSSNESLEAVLYDVAGPVAGAKVTFNLNGVNYIRITDKNGIAHLKINLNSGSYTAIVTFGNISTNVSIVIISSIIGTDIIKMFHNDTQYYAYFCDSDGNPLINSKVTFNINGVFYNRTTNASGIAKLNINLGAGNYILTAYNLKTGEAKSNNIEVLPILVGKDLIKEYGVSGQYEVTAYDSQGNFLANATIIININGVLYHKITDYNGVARLNINLNPGEYIATAYYKGFTTSNKITVL